MVKERENYYICPDHCDTLSQVRIDCHACSALCCKVKDMHDPADMKTLFGPSRKCCTCIAWAEHQRLISVGHVQEGGKRFLIVEGLKCIYGDKDGRYDK